MSIVTAPKVLSQELQFLINSYIDKQIVTKAVSKKNPNVSFASKHLGKPTYGRKSRRYA